ncbi:hypothetical protein BD408DRAFT_412679 [Parasitella parasitica]|nr:hypothetical protein BD408DRAFT_412679 [Parasitella parasitica]
MVVRQSHIKKDIEQASSVIVKEEVNTSVNKVEDLPLEKKNDGSEEEVKVIEKKEVVTETVAEVVEGHYDESSSIKSHTLSAATSSADETDICTPEHEANTVADVKHSQSSAQTDTQNNNIEKIKFDWTEESVKAALPPINRDIITVSTSDVDSAESIATAESITTATATVTESQQQESTFTATVIKSQQSKQKEQEEYVVIDYPAEQVSIKEQVVTTPATVTMTNTEEKPVLSEKVEVSPTPLSSSLTASAPEFVPKSCQQPKKPVKKFLTRDELIEQQRQHHMPRSKARCSHWPRCTNNNCKFFHPYRPCRAGDDCSFGDRCMFVHPNDCAVNVRDGNKNTAADTTTSIPA